MIYAAMVSLIRQSLVEVFFGGFSRSALEVQLYSVDIKRFFLRFRASFLRHIKQVKSLYISVMYIPICYE